MFSPYLGIGRLGGGGGGLSPNGLAHKLLMQFFTLGSSKSKFPKLVFFDIVTTHNDHSSYVKHSLGGSYLFFTLFGYWVWGGGGASPNGVVHHLLVQIFTLGRSKLEVLVFLYGDHSQ